MKVTRGTRYLLITCAAPADGQFRGVQRACRLLAGTEGVGHLAWQDRKGPAAAPALALRWVAVSGHGCEDDARVSDGEGHALFPRDLPSMSGKDLYLLACYQGREAMLRKWRETTGATVHACGGETESALSALFLLALLEHGPESAPHWFDRWSEANERLRPDFPEMRRLYDQSGRDFTRALESIAAVVDLGPFRDVLAVAERHAPVLSGLG